jgi:hypothetical protein
MTSVRFLALVAVLLLVAACGGGSDQQSFASGVIIETVAPSGSTAVSQPPAAVTSGAGQPASASATTAPADPSDATPTEAPTTGRWIDVDVTNYRVRLMDGTQVLQTISPVAVGAKIDTGDYESTQTGLFHVYNKIGGLQYDAPYQSYISDWVAFDPDKDNGFHSFLKDANGAVTDASTGRISNGCIRSSSSGDIFAFAEIGMPVLVHF